MDMAGLRALFKKGKPLFGKANDILRCRCIPMCTSNEYMTEITEIDYDSFKEQEAIGYDNITDER